MATTKIAIRRNTAIAAKSLVEVPVLDMRRTEVPYGSMVFSFDPLVGDNERLVFKCDDEATRDIDQHLERPFMLVNWVAKKVPIASDDGTEDNPGVRLVLIDNEEETLAFVSVGVCSSLDLLRTFRGDGPYDPPIPVLFKRLDTRSGFKTIKMFPAPEPAKLVAKK